MGSIDENQKRIKYYMSHTLKMEDTFKFNCRRCGECCKNRSEAIMLTGVDLYHIAKALKTTQSTFIMKNCESYIGDTSKLPVVILSENEKGECPLLKNNRCTVQEDKPTVCKIFPLGRLTIAGDDHFTYFTQPNICAGEKGGKQHTLKEWLDMFNIEQRDEECRQWNRMIYNIAKHLRDKKISSNVGLMYSLIFNYMYLDYNTDKPFVESLEENRLNLSKLLGVEV